MIDRKKLITLMDGDEALADLYLNSFKEQVREQLPLIAEYLKTENWMMLSNAVHIMKTQTAYMGLDELSSHSQIIESMLDENQDFTKIPNQVNKLINQLSLIIS